MGELISLDEHRSARAASTASETARLVAGRPAVSFAFDLASPWTYLAAERVERAFPGAEWQPVAADALCVADRRGDERDAVEARAADLGMPLIWPDGTGGGRRALRMAAWAAEQGQAPAFVLAATRLAYCGGFDLDDPEILGEAAGAAGLDLEEGFAVAEDAAHDGALFAAGRALRAQGAERLPAVRVGRLLFSGEPRLAEAAAALRDQDAVRGARS